MRSAFRDLVAYRLSVELADGLHRAVKKWPASERSLGDQLVRAADSIGANIAEASGRWHRNDERRFLRMARGSLYETEQTLNGLINKHNRS